MYQPSPSPSQQPHQPPTPTQAQAALQQTLCRLLHFTPEDLQWNRQGALSPAQRRRFERRRARVNVYLYLGLGLIVSGVLTISVQGITHIVPPQLGFIGLIAIACIPIGFFTFIPMRGLLSHSAEQLQAGVISAEEDVLLKRSIVRRDADGDPFTSYYYSVGALEFEVRKKVYEALPNGTRCRLCSLPPDPTLSASPRERRDAPQKFQPGRYEEIIEQRRQGMKNDFLSLELLEPPR